MLDCSMLESRERFNGGKPLSQSTELIWAMYGFTLRPIVFAAE